jgi:hypothetical protein
MERGLNSKIEESWKPTTALSFGDTWTWAGWGEKLMSLHIGYETVAPFGVTRADTPDEGARAAGVLPKPILKADRDNGRSASTAKLRCRASRKRPSTIALAIGQVWSGSLTSIRKRSRRTPLFERNSTPTASLTTRKR